MSEHDPLCYFKQDDLGDWEPCNCLLIAEVRADEREQAAQRVLDAWEVGALLVCEHPDHMLASTAVAAARGEGDGHV